MKRLLLSFAWILFPVGSYAVQEVLSGEIVSVAPSAFTAGQSTTVVVRIRSTSGSGDVIIEADSLPAGWSVSPINRNPTITQGSYYDQTFTITPTNEVGSGIIVWKLYDDDYGIHPWGSTLLATKNQYVSAALPSFRVSATAGSGGSVSPSSRTVTQGYTTIFTVSPNVGYVHDSVGGDAAGGSWNGDTYVTAPVTQDRALWFNFTARPDLVISSMTRSQSSGYPGDIVTIASKTKNNGPGDTGWNTWCKVRYYLGRTYGELWREIGWGLTPNLQELNGISAGEEESDEISWTITYDIPPGTYYITAVADADGDIAEWDESLNKATVSFEVLARTFNVSAIAETGGTVNPSSCSVTEGSRATFAVFPSPGYVHGSVSGDVSGGAWNGNTYTTGPVIENRTLTFSFTAQPDLVISSLIPAYDHGYPEQIISIESKTKNNGPGDTGWNVWCHVRYYLGRTSGELWREIGSGLTPNLQEFNGISVNEEETDTISWTVDSDLTPGTYYLTAMADADGEVSEWNGDNNSRTVAFEVAAFPRIVAAYWLMPIDVSDGDTATMFAEVEGISPGASCMFQVYEDDGGWPWDDSVGSSVTGLVYEEDGATYVKATCPAVWQDDQWGDPEHYFKVTWGPVSGYSPRDGNSELIVRNDRQQPSPDHWDFYYSPGEATVQTELTDARIPVILIHGASGDRKINSLNYWYGWANGDMAPDGAQLGRFNEADMRTRFRVYRYVYDSRRPIADNGKEFAMFVNQFFLTHPDLAERQVVIVAHSMGGLVSRYALNWDSTFRSRVHRLITLGTPHLGSPLADPSWVRQESPSESPQELFISIFYYSNFGGTEGDFDLAWYDPSQLPAPARLGGSAYLWTLNKNYFRQDLLDASLTSPFAGSATMSSTSGDGKITAFGGHVASLIEGQGATWPEGAADEVVKFGITDHYGLHTLRNCMVDMDCNDGSVVGNNDGMVPLTSALLSGHPDAEKIDLTQQYGEGVDHSSYLDVPSTIDYVVKRLLTMVKVTIFPQSAVDAGARWRIGDGAWQKSGVSLNALKPGQYTIEFKDAAGWAKPASQTVIVTENETYTLSGAATTYEQLPSISVTPDLQDFGPVQIGMTVQRTFTVKNVGGGTLSGSATVPLPFSVVSGSPYSLVAGATQEIVVSCTPTVAGPLYEHVVFTGGGGAGHLVAGSAHTTPVIVASATPGGSIAPSGTVEVALGGQQAFSIAPDEYYYISDIKVDGASVGATNAYLFDGVVSNRSIQALFAAHRTTQGVPWWWLASYGLTNQAWEEAAATDQGGGMLAWQAWIAGTDPTDPSTTFQVIATGHPGELGQVILRTVPGRRYVFKTASSISAPSWQLAEYSLSPTGGLINVPLVASSAETTIYLPMDPQPPIIFVRPEVQAP